ncbi:hypothetical protein CK203_116718 [Vitis vinifera]|uniref:Uncharacterized protein n=1 Tax=Vitis vinifera TaxID=29760 RepID=A0A438FDT9_VITVI|nr:hypothetical protein CK203_116718 [Vitis vinifera]
MFLLDALLRHNIFPLQHMVQRRGAILEALFRISEGFYFGPHHLIMTALLYFEEKVHRKKLLRADAIPLLFPRLLYQILEHLGYPSEPHLERALVGPEHPEIPQPEEPQPEQPEKPQQAEIPTKIIAPAPVMPSIGHTPEVTSSIPPTTLGTPPIVPATSVPHPSESSIAISISEFKGLCHTLQTLTAIQSVLAQ